MSSVAKRDPQVVLTSNASGAWADDPLRPSRLEVHIKALKTDPFRQGISLFIGRVTSDLCPVSAMLAYMVVRVPFSDLAMVGH